VFTIIYSSNLLVAKQIASAANNIYNESKKSTLDIALGKTYIDSPQAIMNLSYAEESRLWQFAILSGQNKHLIDLIKQRDYNQVS